MSALSDARKKIEARLRTAEYQIDAAKKVIEQQREVIGSITAQLSAERAAHAKTLERLREVTGDLMVRGIEAQAERVVAGYWRDEAIEHIRQLADASVKP